MTLQNLADALHQRQANAKDKFPTTPNVPPAKLVSFYTRCGRCGKSLFMDDALIVEQSTSAENFLERCAKRLFEHHCNSGTTPQI